LAHHHVHLEKGRLLWQTPENNRHWNSLSTSSFYSALGKRTKDVFQDHLLGKHFANFYTIFETIRVIKDRLCWVVSDLHG
jgi:hypothetical protein